MTEDFRGAIRGATGLTLFAMAMYCIYITLGLLVACLVFCSHLLLVISK